MALSKQEDCQNRFSRKLMQRGLWSAQRLRSRVDRSTPSITDMTSLADKFITLFSEALPLMALSGFQGIMELYVTRALITFYLKLFRQTENRSSSGQSSTGEEHT